MTSIYTQETMLFHTTFYVTNRSAECGVELGSVDSNSQVQLRTTDMGFELGYEGVERFRDISLYQQGSVTANNSDIQLQGQNISITEQAIVSSTTRNSQAGGNLTVNASESIEIADTFRLDERFPGASSGLVARVASSATGQGGNITGQTHLKYGRN